jgi:hypothetical protein
LGEAVCNVGAGASLRPNATRVPSRTMIDAVSKLAGIWSDISDRLSHLNVLFAPRCVIRPVQDALGLFWIFYGDQAQAKGAEEQR